MQLLSYTHTQIVSRVHSLTSLASNEKTVRKGREHFLYAARGLLMWNIGAESVDV